MIARDEAYLWHVRPDRLGPSRLRACRARLGDAELAREQAIRRPAGRLTYLVARALVRSALSAYTGVPPRAFAFRRGLHGRPAVAAPEAARGLRFSLSHTDGLVVCVVARVDAGVDAEPLRRRVAVLALARRFFTPAEFRHLHDVPHAYRTERFLELWTLKEAYLKARGLGLAGGLDTLSGLASAGEPAATRPGDDDPRSWELGHADVSTEHVVAYALRGHDVRLHTCPADRVMR